MTMAVRGALLWRLKVKEDCLKEKMRIALVMF
jgi:hypothetical protein